MALINCPECNKEISDTVKRCPNCGYKFKRKIGRKGKILIIVASVSLICGIGIGGFFAYKNIVVPSNDYKSAEKKLVNGSYLKAASKFEELGDYKDSPERIKECYYKYGESLLEEDELEKAIDAFEIAGDYKDSLERIKECYYKYGELLLVEDDFEGAIDAFEKADDYMDADNMLEQAEDALEEKEKEEVIQDRIDALESAYGECEGDNTYLSSDGLSLTIDGEDEYDYDSLADILIVIESLDLPDSLWDEMLNTSALMGKQSAKYDDYEVSWSYHPDNGLDAIFKVLK